MSDQPTRPPIVPKNTTSSPVTPSSATISAFACRKCRAPLEIDSSFVELKESEFLKECGLDPDSTELEADLEKEDKPGMRAATALSLVIDSKLNLDYPLCEECAGATIQEIQKKLDLAERELDIYQDHLQELVETGASVTAEDEFEREMAKARKEEEKLVDELGRIEHQREALTRDMKILAMEKKELETVESRYWQDFNDFQALLSDCEEQRDAVCSRIDRLNAQLEKLKRTNVYNDVFHIWHDGHFGTINNLRLGRLPSIRVPWDEINAAWGQAVLLLYSLARKSQFTFSTYRLIPMGSFSKMARISDSNTFELHTTGPVLGFWSRRYDQAMTWFLHCLQEFSEWATKQDPSFKLPYWIKNDAVNGMCIKVQMNKEEEWTKALKYMLTNLKWLLAWVARREKAAAGKSEDDHYVPSEM